MLALTDSMALTDYKGHTSSLISGLQFQHGVLAVRDGFSTEERNLCSSHLDLQALESR